ncbi:MAG: flagellin FliC [Magnetococcus sp. MYC-9]
MAITISSNAASLRTAQSLSVASNSLKGSFERLSSGLRIRWAKDDVAGFSISTRMETRIRDQNQALQNVGDAIAMTQIADAGLKEGAQVMQRMWELAVQAANGTYGATDRQSLDDEFSQLKTQLEQLASHTEYNGQKLLDGSMSGKKIQIGGTDAATSTLEWLSVDARAAQLTQPEAVYSAWWNTTGGTSPSILTQEQAEQAIGDLSTAINSIATQRTRIGSFETRLQSIQSNLQQASVETSTALSKIRDADMAHETASLASNTIIQNATTAILAQANQQPALAMKLFS